MDAGYDQLHKYSILGEAGVGKTSFLLRFSDDTFADHVPYMGLDFKIKTLQSLGQRIKLQLWDTVNSRERFRTVPSSYYRGAHGVFVLFDVNDIRTFRNIKGWLQEIERYARPEVVVVLVGTKIDLGTAKREVGQAEASEFAESLGHSYVEISSRTGEGVTAAVEKMVPLVQRAFSDASFAAGKPQVTKTQASQKGFFARLFSWGS